MQFSFTNLVTLLIYIIDKGKAISILCIKTDRIII